MACATNVELDEEQTPNGSVLAASTNDVHCGRHNWKVSNYEEMEVIAVVSADQHGHPLFQISGITTLKSNCVAVMHNSNKITLFSASAQALATFEINLRIARGHSLTADPVTNELIFIDGTSFNVVAIPEAGSLSAQPSLRIQLWPPDEPYGLAISTSSRQVYTACGSSLVGCSMVDFAVEHSAAFTEPEDNHNSYVLAVTNLPWLSSQPERIKPDDDWLLFTGNGGSTLKAVPIFNSKLLTAQSRTIADDFLEIRGLVVDDDGNLLVADAMRSRIEILTHELEPVCAFAPKDRCQFAPAGVALLTQECSNSRIAVVPDLCSDSIFFFGLSVEIP